MRKCVLDKKDPFLALLDWRNTSSETIVLSAVERLFRRKTRTRLTFTAKHLQNQDSGKVTRKLVDRKIKKSSYYNRGAREMSKLHEEDTVRIRPFGREKRRLKIKSIVALMKFEQRTDVSTGGTADILDIEENHF